MSQELYEAIRQKITQCEALCDGVRNDSYLSVSSSVMLSTLRELYERLQSGAEPETLLADLTAELPELLALRDSEAKRPTFDWYDEHHHYKVLDGRCDAYRAMIELLRSAR